MTVADTLSFLFADLRDYTAFVEAHGDAAAAALIADYRRLVRAEVARAGGGEIKTEGDSFYVVFPSARQALQAGIGILQEAERRSRERPERPLPIGVGIHAGEPVPHEGQYVGSAVNIAARLAQQAGAGELLVSEVVRGLLRTSGAPAMRGREGVVLKGIAEALRVYAVAVGPARDEKPAGAPAPGEVAIPAAPPADRRILCPELVGREPELAALGGLLRDALSGRGRTGLLAGEAGLGKSAALRAFAERARAQGAQVLVGECTEIEARRPFGPFVEIAEGAHMDLSTHLPEPLDPGGAEPLDPAERYRVHAAFAKLFGELSRSGPVVIAVEDLHWADEATLELFPYLARKLRGQSVLLLGTYRSDEVHRLHPLNRLLAELARGRLVEEVRLHRLTSEETGAVIRASLGLARLPTPEFRDALQERCEGNPFFIEEVLRALVERGDLAYSNGAWRRSKDVFALAIPVSVRDAVQQRMRLLSADARRVMHVAAVIGQRFDFELLGRVTGLAEMALLEALRSAVDAQLVEEETAADGEDRYLFRHALTRESVLAELLQRERRLLHRAIGESVEAAAGATVDRAEELAYHFDQARDSERALRYHEVASREATRMFAFARSVEHLERAIELAADDDPSLGELQLRLADAAWQASDTSRAVRAAEEARRLFETAGDAGRSGATLRRLSLYRWQLGETQLANELAKEAVRMLESLGESAELAAAQAEVARLAMVDERTAEAIEWGQRAIEMARKTEALEPVVMALNTVGTAMISTDPAGLALLRESLDLALKHDLVYPANRAYNNLWVSMGRLGMPAAELRGVYEEMVEHGRHYEMRFDNLISFSCSYAFADGHWDEALRLVEEGGGHTIWSAVPELLEAFIKIARGGPAHGRALVDAPRARLLAAGDAQWVGAAAFSVPIMLLAGDLQAALAHAEVASDLVARDNHPSVDLAVVAAISAARALQDEAATERWIELAIPRKETKLASHPQRARAAFARAERSAGNGDLDSAITALDESAMHFSEVPLTYFAAHWVRLRRAELLLERGAPSDREAAQAELDAAVSYWRKAKATWYLGKLQEWAAERGLRFPDG